MNPASVGCRMVFKLEAIVTWLPLLRLPKAFMLLILPSAPLQKRNHFGFRMSLHSHHCGSPAISEREKLLPLRKERSFVSSTVSEGKELCELRRGGRKEAADPRCCGRKSLPIFDLWKENHSAVVAVGMLPNFDSSKLPPLRPPEGFRPPTLRKGKASDVRSVYFLPPSDFPPVASLNHVPYFGSLKRNYLPDQSSPLERFWTIQKLELFCK